MILYHIDRAKTFKANSKIELCPLEELGQDSLCSPFFKIFHNGISKHCMNYFNSEAINMGRAAIFYLQKIAAHNSYAILLLSDPVFYAMKGYLVSFSSFVLIKTTPFTASLPYSFVNCLITSFVFGSRTLYDVRLA